MNPMDNADYAQGAEYVLETVRKYKAMASTHGDLPQFAFAHPKIAVAADIGDVMDVVCRNQLAKDLVSEMMLTCKARRWPNPTYMMLSVSVAMVGLPVERIRMRDMFPNGKYTRMDVLK